MVFTNDSIQLHDNVNLFIEARLVVALPNDGRHSDNISIH